MNFSLQQLQHIRGERLSFALFRMPGENIIRLCAGSAQKDGRLPDGFVFAPFSGFENYSVISPDILLALTTTEAAKLDLPLYEKQLAPQPSSRALFEHNVTNALESIRKRDISKVVLSRCKVIKRPAAFNAIDFFVRLAHRYDNAFVYLLSDPEAGVWTGATPELLLETESTRLRTVALAGTKLKEEPSFSPKEIHEQQLVIDYIMDILRHYCADLQLTGPDVHPAGRLVHLITRIEGTSCAIKNIGRLLLELHPTPAVCGLPKEKAKELILSKELYDRQLYSGFIGFRQDTGHSRYYVNLRCMQVLQGEAVLYAGAGIVEGSVPAEEWQETENKMETLLDVIRQYGE